MLPNWFVYLVAATMLVVAPIILAVGIVRSAARGDMFQVATAIASAIAILIAVIVFAIRQRRIVAQTRKAQEPPQESTGGQE